MKKFAFILFLLNIVLSACSKSENPGENVNADVTAFDNYDVVEGLETQTDLWIDAYYNVLESGEFISSYLYLVDIDFDGVPEIFSTRSGTGGTWIDHGFTFKDGRILEIQFAEPICTELELYIDIKTNQPVWIASGMSKGSSSYSYAWEQIDFSDISNVIKHPFFECRQIVKEEIMKETKDGEVESYTNSEYQIIDSNLNITTVTAKGEIEEQFEKAFSQYERVETLILFTSNSEFVNEKNLYDYDSFRSFMQLYDTTARNNALIKAKAVFDLPVYYIYNENLYNNAQFSDSRLSLITKCYTRMDKDTRTDIDVKYIELNSYYDENIRSKWNHRLKEWAFFDWHVSTETGIALEIFQIPTFYRNYLSIRKRTDCKSEWASHPWSSLSAVTMDIESGEEIRLSDILIIDDRIKEKIYASKFINNRFPYETCMEFGLYEQLYEVILNAADSAKDVQNNVFYLEETGIVFIVNVPHIMGDYLEFKIAYEDLADIWCGIE